MKNGNSEFRTEPTQIPAIFMGKPIMWSDEWEARTDQSKIDYLKKLCSAQNSALETLQNERDDVLKAFEKQEVKLKDAAVKSVGQGNLLEVQLNRLNKEKQELNELIVEVTDENRKLKKECTCANDKLGNEGNLSIEI